jgi:hypothetical protein
MSSTSDTTASSHQATPGMAHTAGTAGHSDRLGLVFRTAPSHEFGHKATAAARAVSGHALVDALLVALLVAFLGFAAAETHVGGSRLVYMLMLDDFGLYRSVSIELSGGCCLVGSRIGVK